MKTRKRKVLLPALLLVVGVAIASGARAADKDPTDAKAGRDTASVMKDIREGKAKKVKSEKVVTGVWDGCKFHYLQRDQNDYQFDDGSVAGISENPDPLPKDNECVTTRNPTPAEMAEMDRKVAERSTRKTQVPGGPPPPTPGERPAGAYRGTP